MGNRSQREEETLSSSIAPGTCCSTYQSCHGKTGIHLCLVLARDVPGDRLHTRLFFDGLQKGSYILLSCHYWFQVTSRTPELWTFRRDTSADWEEWHRRSLVACPLDLILVGGKSCETFDLSLRNAVMDPSKMPHEKFTCAPIKGAS